MIHTKKTEDLHYYLYDDSLKHNLNIVDLGLNYGSFCDELQKFFNDKASFYGVEANKEVINYDKKIVTDNFLISNTSGAYEKLYLNKRDTGSSSTIFKENIDDFIEVETITLEDYYKKYNLEKKSVYILKIDIEGKEFEILDTKLIKFLSKCTYQICIEFHDFLVQDNRFDQELNSIFKIFDENNFIKIKFSRNNGSLLFINRNFFKLSFLDLLNIYINKYKFGIQRKLKRIL